MITATPAISVAIPAHNAATTLAAQLDAVLAQTGAPQFEIVVADDGSTDGTDGLVRDYARRDDRVRLERVERPRGPSAARNRAVHAANATVVACCDADDIVADGWLAAMARALADHPFVGGVLEVDLLNDRTVVEARGGAIAGQVGQFNGVRFAHGCNLGIDRALFESSGGFDESLRTGEEIDFAIRLARAGVVVHEAADAVVHYRYRSTPGELRSQAFAQARVVPRLAKSVRASGLGAPSRVHGLRAWGWLALHMGGRDAASRLRWQWVLASSCGRIVGAVRDRALYL